MRARLLDELIVRLEQRDLLVHILASYQLRNICHDYCPPIHLQQLKKALVSREEFKRVEDILKQFPARQYSTQRIDELCKKIRKTPREEVRAVVLRFAEDFMRLRRDIRNFERLSAAMERVHLVRNERTRELSEMNRSLYESCCRRNRGRRKTASFPTPSSRRTCAVRRRSRRSCWLAASIRHRSSA